MAYVSSLLGRPVADAEGERVGSLEDLVALVPERGHPQITAIVVKSHRTTVAVSINDVVVLIAPAIPLRKEFTEIAPYHPGENELYLARDLLDKQIIDTDGIRVVRVNDLELLRAAGHYYVANVDIGGLGLLRRLGLAKPVEKLARLLGRPIRPATISWENVELLPGGQPMRLRVPSSRIAELHPADLAEILSDLSRSESSALLDALDVKTVADTLEEVEPEFQVSLVEALPDEKVADVLEEMAPDEAADLLAELPPDRSQELLNMMEDEEAADVRKLLSYPEDTAGGLMTTEFATVRADLTAEEALRHLRETVTDPETLLYVYVLDEDERLIGVFSLGELVLAPPDASVRDIMEERVVSVRPEASQDEVAQVVAKYNLLAVPVVDTAGHLHGIVTADDALDKVIPTSWKKRMPRWYH